MKEKLTPWFPAHINPVRVGYYKRKYISSNSFPNDYWDGTRWHLADSYGVIFGLANNRLPWRGRSVKP